MATTSDIVHRAYRKIGVGAVDEALTGDEAAHGLAALNAMMHSWIGYGINYEHTDLALGDTFPMAARWHEGVAYQLARRLSPDFGRGGVDDDAWFRQLQIGYLVIEPMELDPALTSMRGATAPWGN